MNEQSDANIISVSTKEALMQALSEARGGEVIELDGGDYGGFTLYDRAHAFARFPAEVTIRSADPQDRASFSAMELRGVENLTIENVVFDYDADPGAPGRETPFVIRNSANIAIRDSRFDGDLAEGTGGQGDGYGTGYGLQVRNSRNVAVENSEFTDWLRAAIFNDSEGLTLKGNEAHRIRSDGFDFAQVSDVLIENNSFHDFSAAPGSKDHRDMIQFWTSGTDAPSTDIVIRGNYLDSGQGVFTQSIFMRNEEVDSRNAGEPMFYRNVTIENNVIHNGQSHGIRVGETLGLRIANNTLLHNADSSDGSPKSAPVIRVSSGSQDVEIIDNITAGIAGAAEDGAAPWTVSGNLEVQRQSPQLDNYYGDLFVDALGGGNSGAAGLRGIPGGVIEQLGVGAEATRFNPDATALQGYLMAETGEGVDSGVQNLSIGGLYADGAALDLTGAVVIWDFGDGAGTQAGASQNVSHDYATAGSYRAVATVTLSDGRSVTLTRSVEAGSPLMLHADFNDGAADQSDAARSVKLQGGAALESYGGGDDMALRLNGGKVAFGNGPELRRNAAFTLLAEFRKDPGAEQDGGGLIYYSGSFTVTVKPEGLVATIVTSAGARTIKALNAGLDDSDWHQVALTFSGDEGVARLYLDGEEIGAAAGLDGGVQTGSGSAAFTLGNPFKASFGGLIRDVAYLKGAMTGAAIAATEGRYGETPPAPEPVDPPAPVPAPDALVLADMSDLPPLTADGAEGVPSLAADISDTAVRLNGGAVSLGRNADYRGNDAYTLMLDFQKSAGHEADGGWLIYYTRSFAIGLTAEGLAATIHTTEGAERIRVGGLGLDDLDWHRLALTFSGATGEAVLYLDGAEIGQVGGLLGGVQTGRGNAVLYLGSQQGKAFGGAVDGFTMYDEALDADMIAALGGADPALAAGQAAAPALGVPALSESVLQASAADDVFAFADPFGAVRIEDFDAAADKLDFSGNPAVSGLADLDLRATVEGVELAVETQGAVLLAGVSLDQVQSDVFLF